MNKEELENAFNETTDNAVKVINDYKELIVRYNIMKENAETLAKRIDRAIEYSNNCLENLKNQEDYTCESIDIVSLLQMIHKNYSEILKGSDKE